MHHCKHPALLPVGSWTCPPYSVHCGCSQSSSTCQDGTCPLRQGRSAWRTTRRLQARRRGSRSAAGRKRRPAAGPLQQPTSITTQPDYTEPLLRVLEAQGLVAVSPADRDGLHPLLLPLARAADGRTVTGLLRRVSVAGQAASTRGVPVIEMAPGDCCLTLRARTAEELLHRMLAQEDAASGPGRVAEACGPEAQQLYAAGATAGAHSLDAYLCGKAGMFPDVVERLVDNHWRKGDKMSALITGEWSSPAARCMQKHFPGWGRPFEFNAQLYRRVGRHEEARDSARIALHMPWWTFLEGWQAMRELAGMKGDARAVHAQLQEQTAMHGRLPLGAMTSRDDRQVVLGQAELLLNIAAAGESTWDEIRPALAEKYREAGLPDAAAFVEPRSRRSVQ